MFCVCRSPILHTGINMFVCNMALSDMVMCLTAAPLTPITSFYGQWYLGELLCKILPAFQVRTKVKLNGYLGNIVVKAFKVLI